MSHPLYSLHHVPFDCSPFPIHIFRCVVLPCIVLLHRSVCIIFLAPWPLALFPFTMAHCAMSHYSMFHTLCSLPLSALYHIPLHWSPCTMSFSLYFLVSCFLALFRCIMFPCLIPLCIVSHSIVFLRIVFPHDMFPWPMSDPVYYLTILVWGPGRTLWICLYWLFALFGPNLVPPQSCVTLFADNVVTLNHGLPFYLVSIVHFHYDDVKHLH